jgi:hypothetical protein
MPQSLSLLLVHFVFSTKERFPYLGDAVRPSLHGYLATVARNRGTHVTAWAAQPTMFTWPSGSRARRPSQVLSRR